MIRIVKLDHSPLAYPDKFIAALDAQAAQRDQMPLTAENLKALVTGGDATKRGRSSWRGCSRCGRTDLWPGRTSARKQVQLC